MNKLTVVSGCPRSGTSLMMLIMREVFGDEEIIGQQFPQEPKAFEQQKDETDADWELRQYNEKVNKTYTKRVKQFEKIKDLNPNGFWECRYTVRGIPQLAEIEKGSIIKVVSQGIVNSSPDHVDKIIYMLRHPRAVAKSQERLQGQFGPTDKPKNNNKDIGKHSPAMFVRVNQMAARWLQKTGNPYLVVEFDDLIENPSKELARVQAFLGKGDFTKAEHLINPKLRRSYPQDIDNPLWVAAENIYEKMKNRDLQGVLDADVPKNMDNEKSYNCFRLGRTVVENECKLCRTCKNTRTNFIKNSIKKGIKWTEHPCTWEVTNKNITVEDSIKKGKQTTQLDQKEMEKLSKNRERICNGCKRLKGNICLEIRKKEGCSRCSKPWSVFYNDCPLGKWNKKSPKMVLLPDALKLITKYSNGKVLELGTGSGRGTEAALVNANKIITIDNMKKYYLKAFNTYKNNEKVIPLLCPLENNTYILPDTLGMFDTIIVDGPRGTEARGKTLEQVIPLLKSDGILLIDDYKRDREVIEKWSKHFSMKIEEFETVKGMAALRK